MTAPPSAVTPVAGSCDAGRPPRRGPHNGISTAISADDEPPRGATPRQPARSGHISWGQFISSRLPFRPGRFASWQGWQAQRTATPVPGPPCAMPRRRAPPPNDQGRYHGLIRRGSRWGNKSEAGVVKHGTATAPRQTTTREDNRISGRGAAQIRPRRTLHGALWHVATKQSQQFQGGSTEPYGGRGFIQRGEGGWLGRDSTAGTGAEGGPARRSGGPRLASPGLASPRGALLRPPPSPRA